VKIQDSTDFYFLYFLAPYLHPIGDMVHLGATLHMGTAQKNKKIEFKLVPNTESYIYNSI
jgi:hypothetical protein